MDENHLATWKRNEENHLENHRKEACQQDDEEEFVPKI
jgi:hypothetical protein